MFYLVEHRVAQATGETPIAVMGEFSDLSSMMPSLLEKDTSFSDEMSDMGSDADASRGPTEPAVKRERIELTHPMQEMWVWGAFWTSLHPKGLSAPPLSLSFSARLSVCTVHRVEILAAGGPRFSTQFYFSLFVPNCEWLCAVLFIGSFECVPCMWIF